MKKNILAVLLALCMLLGLLAGCGSTGTSEASSASETSDAETVSASEASAPEEAPEAAAEETTAEEAVSAAEEASLAEAAEPAHVIEYPLCEETETLSVYCTACSFMGALASVTMDWADFDCFNQVEELTNVHIDFQAVSFESYQSQFNVYIASGDLADLVINVGSKYVGGATAAYEDGVIQDLTPYLEEYAPDYYALINGNETLQKNAYNVDGRVLDFIAAYDEPGIKNGNLVRGDWVEELGIEIETLEDLHQYLLAAKNQFGADVPVYMSSTSNDFSGGYNINSYAVGNGSMGFYVVDGEVRTPLNQEGYKDYLTEMHEWYTEGLLYQDFATQSYDPHDNSLSQMIYNGEVAVWATQLEGLDDYAANSPDENFVSLPIPALTVSGETFHCTEVEYVIQDSDICVSTSCDNVELAVSWMNYWYSDEGILMYNYGPEGDAYHLEDGEVVLEDSVLNNEYGVDISSYLRMFCPYGSFAGIYLRERLTDYSSDLQNEAARIWTESNDGAYVMPSGVSVDAASNETLSGLAADIMTYADTCVPKFIMGDMDLETEWDEYIATLEEMGIDQCIEIQQAAYDAYMGE